MKLNRTLAWSIWAAASIFYAYQYVLRIMPNIMIDDIMGKFHINATVFGQFSGVYYIGYALMHIPIGIALDRFGPKKVMPLCIALTVIGLFPLILPAHWIFPLMGRFLLGIGSSAAALCALKIIRIAFDEKIFTRMLSFVVTVGLLGAIYGGAPLAMMRESLGYTTVIIIFMALGTVLAIAAYMLIPEVPSKNHGHIMHDLFSVIKNKNVMLLAFSAGLMVGPLEGFADVWGSKFLTVFYGLPYETAAPLPSFIFVGMCFGTPLLSLLAEKTNRYVLTVIGAGITMLALFSLLMFGFLNTYGITLSFIMIGVCSGYQILCLYQASTYVKSEIMGLATTMTNMILMTFGYFFHTIMGSLITFFGGANNPQAMVYGLSVIPIALALGILGFFILHNRQKTC